MEARNQVTINRYTGIGDFDGTTNNHAYNKSYLDAKLSAGDPTWSATVGNLQLYVDVQTITTGVDNGVATVDITLGCSNNDHCDDGNTCNGIETCTSSGTCQPGSVSRVIHHITISYHSSERYSILLS